MAVFGVAVLAGDYWRQKIQNYISRRKEALFNTAVREARKAECKRKKEFKRQAKEANRLAMQREIGDPIFQVLHDEWKLAGAPKDRRVWRNTSCGGFYSTSITIVNSSGHPVKHVVAVVVDLRRPWNRQVEVRIGDHVQWPDKYTAVRQIKYLVDKFGIFKA